MSASSGVGFVQLWPSTSFTTPSLKTQSLGGKSQTSLVLQGSLCLPQYRTRCSLTSSAVRALLAVAAGSVVLHRRRSAGRSKRAVSLQADSGDATASKSGRKVVIENDVCQTIDLKCGDTESMDAFMQQNATEVCLQNLQKITPKPDDPTLNVCYLEPNEIGPFRSQMRLTVRVELADTGRCDINILEMETGSYDKKAGEFNFDNAQKMDFFKSDNSVTWKDTSAGGLQVTNRSTSNSVTTLPWWFPVPDTVVQKVASTFVTRIITTGVQKVNEQIGEKFTKWVETK